MSVSFDFLGFQKSGGDGERGEGFEEDWPRGKDCVGGEGGQMSEEAGSLRGGLARGYPGGLQQFERGVPGEGEEFRLASIIARNRSPWPKLCSSS